MKRFIFLLSILFVHTLFSEERLVLVSTAPYVEILKELSGDAIQTELLVPAGFSSHTYEPTARQILKASQAKVWFTIGELFEKKAADAIKSHNPSFRTVDLRQGLPLLYDECGHHHHHDMQHADPHIWMSPKMMQEQAKVMAKTLQEVFPELKENIEGRLPLLIHKLENLDHFIKQELSKKPNPFLVVSHPAYGYFCRDYHLKQLAIEHEGKDPTAKQLTTLIAFIKEQHIHTIFTQKQYSTKAAEFIAKEVGAGLILLDPYAQDYFANMRTIAERISK
jgi:zinc transport system substrate-binding protein